jgi:ArsR family transcriptional regulator, arsenate/arsenite/antimonite-responsive transcriptional repressor
MEAVFRRFDTLMNIEIIGYMLSAEDRILPDGHGRVSPLDCGWTMNRSEVEKISKALADQTRLRIFEAISAKGHVNCGEIVSMRGITPATVSHHLKVLSEAGLIQCRREGQFVYSRSVPETIEKYTLALAKIANRKKSNSNQ